MALRRLPWRVLLGIALTIIGLVLGWMWFKESSLAAVSEVSVTGSTSSESAQVRSALQSTGRGMSTLAIDEAQLRKAVEPYTSVAGLRVRSEFPDKLTVEVIEHSPVAFVKSGSESTPATGGGVLLSGVKTDRLPIISAGTAPRNGRVTDRRTLAALKVAAATPDDLRERVTRLFWNSDGLVAELSEGPELIFGTARNARARWRAAARVLAEESSQGSTYLDLRVDDLVSAGGVGPIEPEATPEPDVLPSDPQP